MSNGFQGTFENKAGLPDKRFTQLTHDSYMDKMCDGYIANDNRGTILTIKKVYDAFRSWDVSYEFPISDSTSPEDIRVFTNTVAVREAVSIIPPELRILE